MRSAAAKALSSAAWSTRRAASGVGAPRVERDDAAGTD
jgi:hypothetical protein